MENIKKYAYNTLVICLIAVGAIIVIMNFSHFGNVEFTDNARVRQHVTPQNTRVQGFIKKIYFEEYQRVRKGDTLVVIEDAEYCLRLAQAEADYRNALVGMDAMHTTVHAAQSNVLVTDAGIEEVRVRLANAEKDYERYKELLKQEAVTVQQFDQVKTEFEATKARYEQILRQRQAVSLVKQEQTQRLEQNEANIKLAEAALNLARLNLSYTVILATTDGVTGRKNIHEGELVQPGQTMVNLVDVTEKWVIANYKETQTTRMEEGQMVDRKDGAIKGHAETDITDLPGIYSMSPYSSEEIVSRNFVLDEKPRALINIVDATNIERNLYLTMQLLEMDIPMVIALNMMDEVTGNQGAIDVPFDID